MAEIARSRTVAAEPKEVWDVLADFGSLSSWAANVDHSCVLFAGPDHGPVGTTRRVQLKRDALVERITEFTPPREGDRYGRWKRVLFRFSHSRLLPSILVFMAEIINNR